jgi:hypothetical protein
MGVMVAHRRGTHANAWTTLCDAGCQTGVPIGVSDADLRRQGWRIEASRDFSDRIARICPVCAVVDPDEDDPS